MRDPMEGLTRDGVIQAPTHAQLTHSLETTVDAIVQQFTSSIGIWPD